MSNHLRKLAKERYENFTDEQIRSEIEEIWNHPIFGKETERNFWEDAACEAAWRCIYAAREELKRREKINKKNKTKPSCSSDNPPVDNIVYVNFKKQ
jgi:hypothetical protein